MGHIIGFVGNMFCGKSEELIRYLVRAKIANLEVVAFKPNLDDRYSDFKEEGGVLRGKVDSHSGASIDCIVINFNEKGIASISDLIKKEEERRGKRIEIIGFDETHLFHPDIRRAIEKLAYEDNREIVWAGLDTDFRGEPFGVVPELMAISDEITKLYAVCVKCGNRKATRSQRMDLVDIRTDKPIYEPTNYNGETVVIGTNLELSKNPFPKSIYTSNCVKCHRVPGKKRF